MLIGFKFRRQFHLSHLEPCPWTREVLPWFNVLSQLEIYLSTSHGSIQEITKWPRCKTLDAPRLRSQEWVTGPLCFPLIFWWPNTQGITLVLLLTLRLLLLTLQNFISMVYTSVYKTCRFSFIVLMLRNFVKCVLLSSFLVFKQSSEPSIVGFVIWRQLFSHSPISQLKA